MRKEELFQARIVLPLSWIKWLRLSPRLSRRAGTQSEHFMTYLTLSKVSGFQLLSLWEGVRGCGNNFSVQRPNLCLSCFKTNTDDPSLPGCKMEAMHGRLQKVKTISGALLPVNSETDFPQWKPDFLRQWKGGVAYICLDKGPQTLIKCPNLYYLLTMCFRNRAQSRMKVILFQQVLGFHILPCNVCKPALWG